MKHFLGLAVLLALCAQMEAAQQTISGEWMLTVNDPLGKYFQRLSISTKGDAITGTARGRPIEGTVKDGTLELKIDAGLTLTGTISGSELRGDATFPDRRGTWIAVRVPARPSVPTTHQFEPTSFPRFFSSTVQPVLTIRPGDTVRTWSVDAGGRDKAGNRRVGGGNPQTGPFYVEGALPNDTLVVRFDKVRTNRDWAASGRSVLRTALDPSTLDTLKWDNQFPNRWTIDAVNSVVFLEKPTEALQQLKLPLAPMVGCVAVAPPQASAIRTGDSGRFGGNMDYNEIREGTTVYLPVYHPGALLFVGDGHASQGDGELTGDALETSMDLEFTVDVLPGKSLDQPFLDTTDFFTSIGIAGTLDQALQQANSGLMRWLNREYNLNPNESSMVLGFAIEYDVVDLVGAQVSIAAKVPKKVLNQLRKPTAAQ